MTRRGSLAYYLAAWIFGCFFMSVVVWVRDLAGHATFELLTMRSAFGLLFFSFYGLILGAATALLSAFLLRRVAMLARWERAWQWTLAGAVLAPILIGALGTWGRQSEPARPGMHWSLLVTLGPSVVAAGGLWLAIPAGAATAFVLYRVHRAFVLEGRA